MERTIAHNISNGKRTDDVPLKECAPFNKWLLRSEVKRGLENAGFRVPTVIQFSAIPAGKSGIDLIIRSKSGTGKTLIFCTVLLENCYEAPGINSLIITPTREIATQIDMVLNQIGKYCKNLRVMFAIGGTDVSIDRKQLQTARTVVGTPGRLVHLIQSNILKTKDIKLVVLDEADQLYGQHRKNLDIIMKALPVRRQILACSATFCNQLDQQLAKIMRNPLLISTKDNVTALLGIKQYVYELELPDLKTSVLEMEAKIDAMIDIFRRLPFQLCMAFAGSQSRAESYSAYLSNSGWTCDFISGAQKQAKRNEIFKKFQHYQMRILVSTDLMARGVDSEHVNLVINIEAPKDMVTYLHRIGRAGRFGSHGIAITFVSSTEENSLFRQIVQDVGCGMCVHEFPKTIKDVSEENFWDPKSFKCELQQEQTTESQSVVLRSQENLVAVQNKQKSQIEINSIADSTASIDTKTFCLDSKDSAINVLPELVAENKENFPNEDTPTSNRSSVQLSANTIDDASSIAADSVFSSIPETHVPPPSLVVVETKNLDFLSAKSKEAQLDEVLGKDLFMDYCTNVLNGGETESNSLEIEEHKNQRFDDMFADYTNFICQEDVELPENNQLLQESSNMEQISNEKNECPIVGLSFLTINCDENPTQEDVELPENNQPLQESSNMESISNEKNESPMVGLSSLTINCEENSAQEDEELPESNQPLQESSNMEQISNEKNESPMVGLSSLTINSDENGAQEDVELPENNQPLQESSNMESISNEKNESPMVGLSSLTMNCEENGAQEEQKEETTAESTERLTESQTFLQDTNLTATNSSYGADSEPSQSQIDDEMECNQLNRSELYFKESLAQNEEANTQEDLSERNVENDTQETITKSINEYGANVSPLHDIWMKEYWRQVNFIESYVKYTLEYHAQSDH